MDNESQYALMLVCLNGHIINDRVENPKDIQEEYCHLCGKETITTCPNCLSSIRGVRKIPGVYSTRAPIIKTESYCYHCGQAYPWHKPLVPASETSFDIPASTLNHIFTRFPHLVKRLAQRYDERSTLGITDEHDLQDFMQVLLAMFFDPIDVVENKAMHNYGGLKSDLLLRNEKIVLVFKMTNSLLKNAKLIEHLESDIETYTQRPNCDTLAYFIYDPDNLLTNPREFKDQLEGFANDKMSLTVFISE